MASGILTGAFSGGANSSYFTYKLIWSSTTEPAQNRSLVTMNWYVRVSSSGFYTHQTPAAWSQTVDGSTLSGSVSFNSSASTLPANTDILVYTQSIYITHGSNGAKTASVSGTFDLSGTSAGTGSLSGNMVLDTIATTPPTVSSLAIADVGTGYSTVGAYVAGYTKIRLTASATAASPATIVSYSFYRDSTFLGTVNTSATSATLTAGSFETAGNHTFKVVVTDSYGNSTTKTASAITVAAYSMPTVTADTFRCNSSGTADDSGTYASCTGTFTFAAVGSNAITSATLVINGSTYNITSGTTKIVSGLSTASTYSAVYTIADKFGNTATITQRLYVTSFVNFDMYPDATVGGVGIGMEAHRDRFDVNHTAVFHEDTEVDANLFINQGLYAYGGLHLMNGLKFASESWVPSLLQGGSGWNQSSYAATYYKLGPIVMVNFLVWDMAIIGGNSQPIIISLPFTPASNRNHGVVGFNGTGLNGLYASASAGQNGFYLCYRNSAGAEIVMTGTSPGSSIGTFQFQMWYFTND